MIQCTVPSNRYQWLVILWTGIAHHLKLPENSSHHIIIAYHMIMQAGNSASAEQLVLQAAPRWKNHYFPETSIGNYSSQFTILCFFFFNSIFILYWIPNNFMLLLVLLVYYYEKYHLLNFFFNFFLKFRLKDLLICSVSEVSASNV